MPECPFCRFSDPVRYIIKKGRDVYRCPVCKGGFVFPAPAIEELIRYYNTEYSEGRYSFRLGTEARVLKEMTFRERWEILRRHVPSPGRVLDVGCSSGTFLGVMEERGWDVYGADISEASCGAARERWGERIKVAGLEGGTMTGMGAEWPQGFDLITLFDVLEHSPEPAALLRGVRGLMNPGGVLAVTTHDFSSLARKFMGRRWSYLDPVEHPSYFSPAALEVTLRAGGFCEVKLSRSGKFVSLNVLLEEARFSNPMAFTLLSPLRAFLPRAVLGRPLYLYLGEIMAVAAPGPRHVP